MGSHGQEQCPSFHESVLRQVVPAQGELGSTALSRGFCLADRPDQQPFGYRIIGGVAVEDIKPGQVIRAVLLYEFGLFALGV